MNITDKSSKADIIDAAIELTDTQSELISSLKQQQRVLIATLAAATVWGILF